MRSRTERERELEEVKWGNRTQIDSELPPLHFFSLYWPIAVVGASFLHWFPVSCVFVCLWLILKAGKETDRIMRQYASALVELTLLFSASLLQTCWRGFRRNESSSSEMCNRYKVCHIKQPSRIKRNIKHIFSALKLNRVVVCKDFARVSRMVCSKAIKNLTVINKYSITPTG